MAGERRKPNGKYHQPIDHKRPTVVSKLRKTADPIAESLDPFRTKIPLIAQPIAAIKARNSGCTVQRVSGMRILTKEPADFIRTRRRFAVTVKVRSRAWRTACRA